MDNPKEETMVADRYKGREEKIRGRERGRRDGGLWRCGGGSEGWGMGAELVRSGWGVL